MSDDTAAVGSTLAFKAYEIEELADVYFFRPLGAAIAYAAMPIGISPTALTVFAGLVGVAGGLVLYDESLGLLAFGLLIVHGIFDSADGQLARLTHCTSELGRVLDGVAGYATHAAAYLAIASGHIARGGSPRVFIWAVAAGVANVVQAQLYDYHRTTYADVVIQQRVPQSTVIGVTGWAGWVSRRYQALQLRLAGSHARVEEALRSRAGGGRVPLDESQRYRASFYSLVRGWNLLGDNTRFYAIGFLAWIHHLEWFFVFILGPMNLALVMLWVWQERADRRFLTRSP